MSALLLMSTLCHSYNPSGRGDTHGVEKTFERVEVAGQSTRVWRGGSGPDVVVLHGWGGRIESMAPALDCLSSAFSVTAIDLPGFGEAPFPQGTWGTPDFAAFTRDVLIELQIARAHFVGHSFGGKVSLYLAAVHRDLVDKLVLVDATGVRLPPSIEARFKKAAARLGHAAGKVGPLGQRLKEAVYSRVGSNDYRDAGPLRPILVRVVNEDYQSFLPRIGSSTLLVWGDQDESTPLGMAHLMEHQIPDAGLVVFEGAGHFSYLDDPERFCRVVRYFLGAPL
jgi:pimeloyl-ACP methyl ester carboxylesterase